MKPNRKYLVVGASSLVLAAGGAGATVAIGGNEDGGAAADGGAGKAKKKALSLNPGGQANSVERDPENGAASRRELRPRGHRARSRGREGRVGQRSRAYPYHPAGCTRTSMPRAISSARRGGAGARPSRWDGFASHGSGKPRSQRAAGGSSGGRSGGDRLRRRAWKGLSRRSPPEAKDE